MYGVRCHTITILDTDCRLTGEEVLDVLRREKAGKHDNRLGSLLPRLKLSDVKLFTFFRINAQAYNKNNSNWDVYCFVEIK